MCRDLIVQGLTPCKSAGIIASTDNFVRYVYRRSQDGLTGRKSLQINIGEEAAFITAQPLLLVCIRRPIASITAWCATVHASTQPKTGHYSPNRLQPWNGTAKTKWKTPGDGRMATRKAQAYPHSAAGGAAGRREGQRRRCPTARQTRRIW